MATTLAIASSSSIPNIATLISCFNSNSYLSLRTRTYPSLPSTSPIIIPIKKFSFFHHPPNLISPTPRINTLGPIPAVAAAEDILPSEATAVEATQQLVSNTDDGVTTIVSALLFVAFIGLSILTIGVIYLGVTDFLQKREKEKFEKEEAANKSGKKKFEKEEAANKSGKKKKKKAMRARAGPRGFGQKIDEEENDD